MEHVIDRMDESGKAAWIVAMILGFVLFWPIGLAILLFMIGSGRMGHWKYADHQNWRSGDIWMNNCGRRSERRSRRRSHRRGYYRGPSSGNTAFDDYREETLRRLEEEQKEFHDFLDRLRQAKDKEEFDQFMAERRDQKDSPPEESGEPEEGPNPA